VVVRIKEKYPMIIKFGYILTYPFVFKNSQNWLWYFTVAPKKGEVKELARPPLLALSRKPLVL
jgi:hypothetical protein